jgi:hypothetical protein
MDTDEGPASRGGDLRFHKDDSTESLRKDGKSVHLMNEEMARILNAEIKSKPCSRSRER